MMPTYDYRCTACSHELEMMQKMTEDPLKICPNCHKESLKRGPGGGIGLSFKGTGFYITDYAREKAQTPSSECCPCGKDAGGCKT